MGSFSLISSSKLYHGTSELSWNDIKRNGFKVPEDNDNWLGSGIYFGINNLVTPIFFAKRASRLNNSTPVILEINGSNLRQEFIDKILDLTTPKGLSSAYYISSKYVSFTQAYYLNTGTNYFEYIRENPLYSNYMKLNNSLDVDYHLLLRLIEDKTRLFGSNSPSINQLRKVTKNNISNLIYDWFNYYKSSGIEGKIKYTGVLGLFNNGNPIFFDNSIQQSGEKVRQHILYDYISFLSRIEYSLFAKKYYTKNSFIELEHIANDESQIIPYIGDSEIIKKLSNSFSDVESNTIKRDELATNLFNTIVNQKDKR